ncbi:aminoglycoside phosphotransferase [Sphaerisporangium siamense]|uniref:Aminoglycoside phosphotransferase family protein n=1 Tax=Sphaerisporangium siamense TaxID=795645 RepID=A0A7W7DCT1_9ACTN|nr:aminoglycoside phosphotransferase family protein [Sphaerisporangium siamense]MBB4704442.1 hypothetical protein [Sphaerisporangium siamense]GII84874.1 aminoglycoside phosphotransferase [Sphaerisporangium siamense]
MTGEGALTSPPLAESLAALVGGGPWTVLKDTKVTVVRSGDLVVKAHPPDTDETALAARLRMAAALPGVLLPPASPRVGHVAGRPVTVWPAGEPVDPGDPDAAPWEAAAVLLARLHATPLDTPLDGSAASPVDGAQATPPDGVPLSRALPPAGGPARVARAVALLDALDGQASEGRNGPGGAYAAPVAVIRAAFATLPREARAAASGLVPAARAEGPHAVTHGDWHLGQIVRHRGAWALIDVDDLGVGVAAWDLARPAAWYATGLLSPDLWERFLCAYLGAGGSAVPAGDPWRELDVPARALTVQLAATAVAAAGAEGRPLDEVERTLVSSCGRITQAAATR